MKVFILFSLISIILLSGCTAQVVETGKVQEQPPVETKETTLPRPQLTSIEVATQESEITTITTVDTTKAPEEPTPPQEQPIPPREPKVFQINVVQGVGIREGAG